MFVLKHFDNLEEILKNVMFPKGQLNQQPFIESCLPYYCVFGGSSMHLLVCAPHKCVTVVHIKNIPQYIFNCHSKIMHA